MFFLSFSVLPKCEIYDLKSCATFPLIKILISIFYFGILASSKAPNSFLYFLGKISEKIFSKFSISRDIFMLYIRVDTKIIFEFIMRVHLSMYVNCIEYLLKNNKWSQKEMEIFSFSEKPKDEKKKVELTLHIITRWKIIRKQCSFVKRWKIG